MELTERSDQFGRARARFFLHLQFLFIAHHELETVVHVEMFHIFIIYMIVSIW